MKFHNKVLQHKKPLNWIQSLESIQEGMVEKSGTFAENTVIEIRKGEDSFSFKFDALKHSQNADFELGHYNYETPIVIDGQQYLANRIHLNRRQPPFFEGTIEELRSNGYFKSSPAFHQLIIPLKQELKFHYAIEEVGFETDSGYDFRTGTKCTIDGEELFVAVYRDNDWNYFLSIQSNTRQSYDDFSSKAYSVRVALGYMTGYFAGDAGYFFSYSEPSMSQPDGILFSSMRPSILIQDYPVNTNPFNNLHYDKSLAEKYQQSDCLRVISTKEFSRLAEKAYQSTDFESALILILESSAASLLFRPGGYSIALETITPMIIPKQEKEKLNPVKDPQLWKRVCSGLKKNLKAFDYEANTDDFDLVSKRINNLNAPNNESKLRAPFEYLSIPLHAEDFVIFQSRNQFLHGSTPDFTNAGKERPIERINADLFYASLRLYTLLSSLILKWMGFDNYVLNYPKIEEPATGIKLNENPYRKL